MNPIYQKYAALLCEYCVYLKPGDKVYIRSTVLAEPLVREVYRKSLQMGAIPEVQLEMREQEKIWMDESGNDQLAYIPVLHAEAMKSFDAYIYIKAPYNLREPITANADKVSIRREAWKPHQQLYFQRAASLQLKRTFCIFPTLAGAQEAEMSLDDYEEFVFAACNLFEDDPASAWLALKDKQQHIVDFLNKRSSIRYKNDKFDISFSTAGRSWINSHGTTNMPSGEVYTSPVEDSVQGSIEFDFPLLYNGNEISGIRLEVKDGRIVDWHADKGSETLDAIFRISGANIFGEAAIGTNNKIDRFTKNILFDEKIGGTIHMAIGQSYPQAGGKNESSVHLDMIADMKQSGEIYADDELIYRNGKFLITS